MPNREITSRKNVYEWFKMFIDIEGNTSKDAIALILEDRSESMAPSYGLAADFGNMSNFIAKALAYNNKQFYVYRAIENPNKIGFLSHKQFYKLQQKIRGIGAEDLRRAFIREYKRVHGKMSSPYKLLKKALKENPRVRFLVPFFKLNDDGSTEHENKLIELCDVFMSKALGLELVETTVQECYDLFLPGGYGGSGRRFATHSCMYRKPVGKFYESLPCHGMMIKRNGEGVGRFLLWDLADGRQYVDRLYCREEEADACLALIDKTYPDALKYPLSSDNVGPIDIKFKTMEPFENKVTLPYIDSFPNLHSNGDELCISNRSYDHNGFKFQTAIHFASGGSSYQIKRCPHCNHLWFGYGRNLPPDEKYHKYICKSYKPRGKELQEYLKVFREMEDELGGIDDEQGFVYEV